MDLRRQGGEGVKLSPDGGIREAEDGRGKENSI